MKTKACSLVLIVIFNHSVHLQIKGQDRIQNKKEKFCFAETETLSKSFSEENKMHCLQHRRTKNNISENVKQKQQLPDCKVIPSTYSIHGIAVNFNKGAIVKYFQPFIFKLHPPPLKKENLTIGIQRTGAR